MSQYPDSYYINYDPFEGDMDTDERCQEVRVVTVRKDHNCWMGTCLPGKPHVIQKGERARFEQAIVDGEWCSYYVCLPCIDAWLKECGIEPPQPKEGTK